MNNFTFLDYWRMIRVRGLVYPFRYFLQSQLFDIRRGTDTHFWVSPVEHLIICPAQKDSVHYVACPTSSIKLGIKAVVADVGNEFDQYQFFDLGCGKGKALIFYSEHAPSAIMPAVGLELLPSLAAIAKKNIELMDLADRVKVVTADAVLWSDYRKSDKVIVFLYNPFGLSTLQRVFEDVEKLRNIYVVYIDPQHTSFFSDMGWKRIFTAGGRYRSDYIDVWVK